MLSRIRRLPYLKTLVFCLPALYLTACATTPTETVAEAEPQELVWPLPPEQPRIRYLGSLASLEDLSSKDQRSLRDILMGEEEDEASRTLMKPYGVYSDSRGRVFVADTGLAGLPVFDLESGAVSFWGVTGLGALTKPIGVTAEPAGPVYVSDVVDNRIVKFDVNGKYLTAFGGKEELPGPSGLAWSEPVQRLFIADTKRHQVLAYTREGDLDFAIGERGYEDGQFNFPTNVAVDGEGRLYVADSMNFRVQVFDRSGSFVKAFGRVGDRPGNLNRLKGIGVDSEGHVYAVDASYNNFQIFDQEGRLLMFVGGAGRGPGQFYLPAGMHIDGNDTLFIADQYNRRIQMFQYLSEDSD